MTTATQIITSALERAGVVPVGQAPTNDKSVQGLDLLNDWIAELKNDGLDLQLGTLALADTVYLDKSDISCLKLNLTVLIAEAYKLPLPTSVYLRAERTLDNLRGKYLEAATEEMDLPDGLQINVKSDIRSGC